ncbi:hypothetical protein AB835_02780 [Candidatus Endobugula sertula]|uniref:Uncharacterized protein n=1 Tax=Candidatus Endobugula sertula TaxID=62101 RepID=A0A1D2QSG8_9GAMM|nr:hypothetical protein AB835_02780 [Candidatus Endobugula sertula]
MKKLLIFLFAILIIFVGGAWSYGSSFLIIAKTKIPNAILEVGNKKYQFDSKNTLNISHMLLFNDTVKVSAFGFKSAEVDSFNCTIKNKRFRQCAFEIILTNKELVCTQCFGL